MIARALAKRRGLQVETGVLRRIRATPPLKGMTRKQKRLAVIAGLAVVLAIATALVLTALREALMAGT